MLELCLEGKLGGSEVLPWVHQAGILIKTYSDLLGEGFIQLSRNVDLFDSGLNGLHQPTAQLSRLVRCAETSESTASWGCFPGAVPSLWKQHHLLKKCHWQPSDEILMSYPISSSSISLTAEFRQLVRRPYCWWPRSASPAR